MVLTTIKGEEEPKPDNGTTVETNEAQHGGLAAIIPTKATTVKGMPKGTRKGK